LNAALGGSVDVAVHLMALGHETGVSLPWDLFNRIARETPQVCRLGGVGEKEAHRIEDLDRAGGVWAIMNALKTQILPTTTINGKGALELAKAATIKDTQVISAYRPLLKQSGIGVLKGNLAPRGAVFLINQVIPTLNQFRGPVNIFENEIAAAQALSQGTIKKGSAIVVRGQGPRGAPGLRKLRILPALMESRGFNKTIPLFTDGRLPDTPAGLFVSVMSPESAVMGPLAVMKNGDLIEIDVPNRQLNVRLTDMDLKIRLSRWQTPETGTKRGFLERYSRSVSEANEGAVLK
jgi:dihydroxy-acid dehydratase